MNQPYKPGTAGDDSKLRVFSKYKPAVLAGEEFTVKVEQGAGGGVIATADDGMLVHFKAEGPHERLSETDVVGRYPAPGSDNSPDEFMSHVALSRRSLPWERNGISLGGGKFSPWMALLVFRVSELYGGSSSSPLQLSTAVEDLKAKHAAVYNLLKSAGYADKTHLDFAWVSKKKLEKVLPLKSEIELLCHGQQLEIPAGEVLDEEDPQFDPMWTLDEDHCVAVVIGSRLPNANTGEEHVACLVSLEKRDDLPWLESHPPPPPISPMHIDIAASHAISGAVIDAIAGAAAGSAASAGAGTAAAHPTSGTAAAHPIAGLATGHPSLSVVESVADIAHGIGITAAIPADLTPLVVLHSWRFTPSKGMDFEQVVKMIRYSPNGGVLRIGVLPRNVGGQLPVLTADGYLPLAHPTEPAGKALYRGPLTPNEVGRQSGIAIRAKPDELSDPQHTGKVDYSYAAAFEIGRLLTLSDAGLLADLQGVRQTITLPRIPEYLTVDPRPKALAKKDWVVDPADMGEKISLPEAPADFTGVDQLKNQVNVNQLANQLEQIQAGAGIGNQVIDIEAGDIASIDAQLAHVVTAGSVEG